MNTQTLLTIEDLSEELSVSTATIKNWIKLNKINISYNKNNTFSQKEMQNIKNLIYSKENNLLKSRRNKTLIQGSEIYKNYITQNSPNSNIIAKILDIIPECSENDLRIILVDCAIKLLCQRFATNTSFNNISTFLGKKFTLYNLDALLFDILPEKNYCLEFLKSYPKISKLNYIYHENEDLLGYIFMSLSNIGNRKIKGAYFTPSQVVIKLLNNLFEQNNINSTDKIFDPCCGTGNFLLQLPQDIRLSQIYGNDIDELSIKIARINMALKFKSQDISTIKNNITCSNYLTESFKDKFDFIIGNPPWGYKFSGKEKELYKTLYKSTNGKSIESFALVIEKSTQLINQNGVISFVLPQVLLHTKTHKIIRKIITDNFCIQSAEFLGEIFHKVQCPSIILQIKHNTNQTYKNAHIKTKQQTFTIEKERTFENLLLNITDEEYALIKKLYNANNMTYLKGNAQFGLGIVTGNNKKYIQTSKSSTNEIILKGSDINKYSIKENQNYIEFEPDKFQQVAKEAIYRSEEKLLYKFISNKLIFAYDNKQRLTLNSCNILIPNKSFNIKYVLAILNSPIAQFIFEKRFNSVKVLREHIEQIPIPKTSQKNIDEIETYVNKLINQYDKQTAEQLDKLVINLYNLNNKEINLLQ